MGRFAVTCLKRFVFSFIQFCVVEGKGALLCGRLCWSCGEFCCRGSQSPAAIVRVWVWLGQGSLRMQPWQIKRTRPRGVCTARTRRISCRRSCALRSTKTLIARSIASALLKRALHGGALERVRVVLVSPQQAGNVGSVCQVATNFGEFMAFHRNFGFCVLRIGHLLRHG
ncbi:hypothetical protein M758_UG263000 [Ceratodon purpureus]|nr:hypothetical protein M758_UG263000 [Ceratodon purpureus]